MRWIHWAMVLSCVLSCGLAQAEKTELEELIDILELRPGSRVADVGAGDGDWSVEIAGQVGGQGLVFATEISSDDVHELRSRIEETGLSNVVAIEGGDRESGLPAECCDAILLRLVYHHFTNPREMMDSLARSLAPGGRLVVIDIVPQASWRKLAGVPERDGHGIGAEDLESELLGLGWRQIEWRESWNGDDERFAAVFVPVDLRASEL